MRRFRPLAALFLTVPLAACFDAEMTLTFPDEDRAEATMVMIAGADFYEMSATSGQPFCEDGVEAQLENGSYSCTRTFSGTIDEAINDPDIGEGMTIERRDGGLLYVAFDIDEVTADLEPPAEAGGEEMIAMMAEAFAGHAITMNVAGGEIVETNGTVSADGKTASFSIPLDGLITGAATLPSGFDVLLRPGT
ncbi:MAG: hypothetical protein KDK11_11445 [Maritimibacter sp.]|nr:hypothetical protein [Maritimibacter sp.]